MCPASKFKGGPEEEMATQTAQKQESKIESSLGQRGMSKDQMLGKPEIKNLLQDIRSSIGGKVQGFLKGILGKK